MLTCTEKKYKKQPKKNTKKHKNKTISKNNKKIKRTGGRWDGVGGFHTLNKTKEKKKMK